MEEGEGEGTDGNINDGNNDVKRNRNAAINQSRESSNQGREKMFETDCQKVWMAVTESSSPANTSSSASFSTSSTSSSKEEVKNLSGTENEVVNEVEKEGVEEFWPAYMLADWTLERAGR